MSTDDTKVKFVLSRLLGPQVGDKIRILEERPQGAHVDVGEIGRIMSVNGDKFYYETERTAHYGLWYIDTNSKMYEIVYEGPKDDHAK